MKKYELTNRQRKQLHECLLKMYLDIKSVCDKYNLTIVLGGGSALGAIRHGGFIPWDDDLDLNMPRKDYDQFLKIMRTELGKEYDFSAPSTNYVECMFLKIYKKGSIYSEVYSNKKYNGVWIDIFPIDTAPNYKVCQLIKGICADCFHFINSSMLISQRDNGSVKQAYKSAHRMTRYYVAKFIGKIIPFGHTYFCNIYDKYVSDSSEGKYGTVATGRNKYAGECMLFTDMFPVRKIEFEGLSVNVYNNVEKYLTKLYGDYMKIPPPEKRETHYVSEFSVSDDIGWYSGKAKEYCLVRE